MPANDSNEFDYVPGYTKPSHEYGAAFGDEFHAEVVYELLLSYAGFTQRGVTLAPGQGVLPTGCVLARHTGSGYYFAYRPSATDGLQNPVGVLRDSRDTGGPGYASIAAYSSGQGIALAGGAQVFPASPAGKVATASLANVVIRGILNANLISGQDTVSLVTGTGGVYGGASISTITLATMGAKVLQFGLGSGTAMPFPGGPMDGTTASSGVNSFIF